MKNLDLATIKILKVVEQQILGKGYITVSTESLLNYYRKTEIYSKEEINELLSCIPKFKLEIVAEKPVANISTSKIYLVPKNDSVEDDVYEEWAYINGRWEKIGNTTLDLSEYDKSSVVTQKIKEIKLQIYDKIGQNTNKILEVEEQIETNRNNIAVNTSNIVTLNSSMEQTEQVIENLSNETSSLQESVGLLVNTHQSIRDGVVNLQTEHSVMLQTIEQIDENFETEKEKIMQLQVITNNEKTKIENLQLESHTHQNKTVIDSINQQKIDEWNNKAGVIIADNLNDDSPTKSLSAKQGKALNENKANKNASDLANEDVEAWKEKLKISSLPIGSIFSSLVPLNDAQCHLLDGTTIVGSGAYSAFVDYMAGLYNSGNYSQIFTTETEWQNSVSNYGACGKFVYNSTNNTIRLPKVRGILQGTINLQNVGDIVEAGLPNIAGHFGTVGITKNYYNDDYSSSNARVSGPFYAYPTYGNSDPLYGNSQTSWVINGDLNMDASLSSQVYGKSDTVQPQTTKVLYYIVIATGTKTNVQINIDNVFTDLANKIDKDGANLSTQNIDSLVAKLLSGVEGRGQKVTRLVKTYGAGGIKFNNGIVINWGYGEIANNTFLNFAIPFTDKWSYSVTASSEHDGNTNLYAISCFRWNGASTKFCANYTAQSTPFTYIAIGF